MSSDQLPDRPEGRHRDRSRPRSKLPSQPDGEAHASQPTLSKTPEDDQRRRHYLIALSWAWVAFGIASLIAVPFYPRWQVAAVVFAGCAATSTVTYLLLRNDRLAIACVAFCVGVDATFLAIFLVLIALVGAAQAFSTEATVLMLMGLTALFAGALVGPRAALIVAAVNTVIIVGLRFGLAPESEPRPSLIVFGWLLAAVAMLYERTLRNVFAQLRGARLGLESTVATRTSELRNSVVQLETLAQQLTSANRDLEFFSASVAHDLRGPLAAIEGYSRLLQEDVAGDNPQAAQALDRMLQVEARMSRLIDGLLAFAHLGHHAMQRQRVAITALAQRTANELRAHERGRILNIDVAPLPDCSADPLLIEQVLVNLLGNAIKFTRPRSVTEIQVRGWIEGSEVVYSVKDNGVGFAMQQADRLFNTLQRLHGQEEFEGTGIGLAAVQRIVTRHGGRVWARAEVGRGAEFFFALPLDVDHNTTGASASSLPSGVG